MAICRAVLSPNFASGFGNPSFPGPPAARMMGKIRIGLMKRHKEYSLAAMLCHSESPALRDISELALIAKLHSARVQRMLHKPELQI
jgi:hypothetical protein